MNKIAVAIFSPVSAKSFTAIKLIQSSDFLRLTIKRLNNYEAGLF